MKLLKFSIPKMDRWRPEDGLRRATIEAEELEERQIDYWLSLADAALDDSWDRHKIRERKAA